MHGNEEHVIGSQKKDSLNYKVAKKLAKLCSGTLWKVELVNNENGYLAEISEQSG